MNVCLTNGNVEREPRIRNNGVRGSSLTPRFFFSLLYLFLGLTGRNGLLQDLEELRGSLGIHVEDAKSLESLREMDEMKFFNSFTSLQIFEKFVKNLISRRA